MGAWGIKTFENDGALDWLGDFLEKPSEQRLIETFSIGPTVIQPGFIGRLLGKKSVSLPIDLEGEEILAAAEVVATISGRPSADNPEELENPPSLHLSSEVTTKALAAIDEMMKCSNLKECWEESDDFQAWKAQVDDLRSRLISVI